MATRRQLFSMGFLVALGMLQPAPSQAWNHDHEAHFNPANPRPDFLPRTLYNEWISYRKQYNRPHPIGGHIAAVIEPTSQEAMAWHIHDANGDYKCKRPGYIPLYYYPKPWEVLPTAARPDTPLMAPENMAQPAYVTP